MIERITGEETKGWWCVKEERWRAEMWLVEEGEDAELVRQKMMMICEGWNWKGKVKVLAECERETRLKKG